MTIKTLVKYIKDEEDQATRFVIYDKYNNALYNDLVDDSRDLQSYYPYEVMMLDPIMLKGYTRPFIKIIIDF